MELKHHYQKAIEKEVKSFRKQVEKMQQSENPYYHDQKVQDYEINKLKESMETEVQRLDDEFHAKMDEEIEAQSRVAARSTFYTSDTEKRLVSDSLDELTADLTFATNDGQKLDAIEKFENKLNYLEDGGLAEVKKRLPEVARKIQGDEFSSKNLRKIYHTFDYLMTPAQETLEELREAKNSGVNQVYRRLRLTHQAYKHEQKVRKISQ